MPRWGRDTDAVQKINNKRTRTLPPELQETGLLDFATEVTTNVNTLFVGDSVAQQLSEAMDESCGMLRSWIAFKETAEDAATIRRKLLWGCGGFKETLSISSPLRGGGTNAYWRMTGLWSTENKGKHLPPSVGGGWNYNQLSKLLDSLPEGANRTFDAVVLNYNSWIVPVKEENYIARFNDVKPGNITRGQYEDSIGLASSLLGVNAAILVTYPFTRTVDSAATWRAFHNVNQMIRRLAMDSRSASELFSGDSATASRKRPLVLVLEFGEFTNQLLWTNARYLGYNVSDPRLASSEIGWEVKDNVTSLLTRLPGWWIRIPQVCAESYNSTRRGCVYNSISTDDMHW